jgi:hypothetical protein
VIKTWKTSTDPDYEAKKNRVLELYDIADGKTAPGDGDPACPPGRSRRNPLDDRRCRLVCGHVHGPLPAAGTPSPA